jgi:hypothetical protein
MSRLLTLLFGALILLVSCENDEGVGGKASISGKVYVKVYNEDMSILQDEYYVPDEEVYIIYGNAEMYNDNISTSYDGTYKFEYLREGSYTVFAYSDDTINPGSGKKIAVKAQVNIGSDESKNVGDLVIYNINNGDGLGGNCSISGKIFVKEYNKDMTVLIDQYYSADEDVYIVYGDGSLFDVRDRTSYDGSYKFDQLIPGNYKVFAYARDTINPLSSQLLPVIKEVEITTEGQNLTLDDIVLKK